MKKSPNIVIVRRDDGIGNGFLAYAEKKKCGIFIFRLCFFFILLFISLLSWAEKDSLIPIVWRVSMLELHIQIKMPLMTMAMIRLLLLLAMLPILAPHCHVSHFKCKQCNLFHSLFVSSCSPFLSYSFSSIHTRTKCIYMQQFQWKRTFPSNNDKMRRKDREGERNKESILIINSNKTWIEWDWN